jgi:hypothetical protein
VIYSFCESVVAISPWHIRAVGPEGQKFSGGAPPPLCWSNTKRLGGWDLRVPITTSRMRARIA